jgi:hypothetical protein
MKDKDNILDFPSKDEERSFYVLGNPKHRLEHWRMAECQRLAKELKHQDMTEERITMFLYFYSKYQERKKGQMYVFWTSELLTRLREAVIESENFGEYD